MSHPLPDQLAAPARRARDAAGITTPEAVARAGLDRIKDRHGVGPNAVDALEKALEEAGLR
ncbi:MAG: DNA-binding protein [Actinomycetales bacterium]|nr:MAG: DNA-binding protein [Actinomycetales bacterium]